MSPNNKAIANKICKNLIVPITSYPFKYKVGASRSPPTTSEEGDEKQTIQLQILQNNQDILKDPELYKYQIPFYIENK